MIEFYRNNFDFKHTYEKFISVVDYLDKNKNPLEIEKLDYFSTPTDISDFIPLLKNLYRDQNAVSDAISNIFELENFSAYKIEDLNNIIVGINYVITNRVIFFINPLSIEAQTILKSIQDYDQNEILFEKIGVILESQIIELTNKIDIEATKKKINLKELSIEKMFQDLMKRAINLKAIKIKIYKEDNFVKASFLVDGFYIDKKDMILTTINYFSDIKLILEKKFSNEPLIWKHFTNFYKIILSTIGDSLIYFDLYNLSENPRSIDSINLKDKDNKILKNALKSPSGLIVISGSNNSGKRSLLYSLLSNIKENRDGVNIITYESEVKSKLTGISQRNNEYIEVNELSHYSVVGIDCSNKNYFHEAFEFASNGKLVILVVESSNIFNTLNMINQTIDDKNYILENLLAVLHTGLLNCVCTSCSNDIYFNRLKESHFFVSLENVPKTTDIVKEEQKDGCDECNYGFKDRIQVTEIIDNDIVLKDLYLNNFNIANYKTEKRSQSWNSVFENSMKLLKEGKISLNSIIKTFGYYKK